MSDMNLAVSIQQIESKRSPAHVAQAVEHFLGKEKVPGSNPGVGSIPSRRGEIRISKRLPRSFHCRAPNVTVRFPSKTRKWSIGPPSRICEVPVLGLSPLSPQVPIAG